MKTSLTTSLFTSLLYLSSCGVQHAVSASTETRCLLNNSQPNLEWIPVVGEGGADLLPQSGTATLPLRYQVYRLNQKGLIAYFRQQELNPADTTRLSLPLPESPYCMEFTVVPSGTLSESLSRKYPELVSLKGFFTGDFQASVRIDFDGEQLSAEIRYNNKTYLISAWPAEEETVYLLYLSTDSGVERKPLKPY